MANSKSSIYPIQLKNAELNLNKYDAEIKQYTGFNKNNAPFVGGCLSNLFTKDNVISGSTNDNTYIDDNGDVYRIRDYNMPQYGIDTWELAKNNETVIAGDNNQFLVNKKLNFPSNTIKVFTEDLYVDKVIDPEGYVFFYIKSLSAKFRAYNSSSVENRINLPNLHISYNIDGYCKKGITNIFVMPDSDTNYLVIVSVARANTDVVVINLDPELDAEGKPVYRYFYRLFTAWAFQIDYRESLGLCYDETGTKQFSIFHAQDENAKLAAFFTIDFENYDVTEVASLKTSIENTLDTGVQLVSNKLIYYHILNYPFNAAILSRQYGLTEIIDFTNNTAFKIVGRLKTPYYDTSDNKVKFREVTTINYPEVKTVRTGQFLKIGEYIETNNRTLTPIMCSCDVQNAVSTEYQASSNFKSWCVHQYNHNYALNGFSFSDYTTSNNDEIKRAKYALGDYVPLGKNKVFYLAFNNNLLSAICSKYVLLTEWNSINAEDVYFYYDYRNSKKIRGSYDERIIYKLKNDWYVIKLEAKPSIMIFENQIVINVNSVNNSYDKERDKQLHFATPYNGFIDAINRQAMTSFYDLTSQENDIYVAGAVREYNQEDNSSIILYPISFSKAPGGTYYIKNFFALCFNEYINIYTNIRNGSSVIKYEYSTKYDGSNDAFRIDSELLDMPFPSDSSGNIEYNVNLFSEIRSTFGNAALIKSQLNTYPLVIGNNNNFLMNYYIASGVEGLEELFVIQGNYYGIMQNYIVSLSYYNGVVSNIQFVVSVEGLQFCGNTPYQAIFFSKTNRCLYAFTGANVLNVMQTIDKISEVRDYEYNPATQSIFLITDTGVIINGLFGTYQIDYPNITKIFLLNNGFVLNDGSTTYRYIKYYKDTDDGYTKQNIELDTCFYGMDNQTVTINDCLYLRLFSEEHEEGSLEVSAVTLSLKGRKTEKTTFKIKASDWDKETHTIYLRYQPKEQRGLGISFKINSPFKIASMSVGSQPDAILIDKVSKGAVNAPLSTSSNINW